MNEPIRLGIVGFAHMHILDLVKGFLKLPDRFRWVGCADVPPATEPLSSEPGTRRHVMAEVVNRCAIPRVFGDYHDLLDEKPQIVLVTCENARHAPVVCDILERGIHVILEKPMAMNLAQAQKMARTAKLHDTRLIVNWPTAWDPAFRLAQRLTRDGAVGRPLKFHYRNRESLGPFSYGQNLTDREKASEWWYQADMGGGAMADYIGYGCNLSRWFLGEGAVAATAIRANFMSHFADVDDYSAAMLRYPSAVALLEGSWATASGGGIPCGPIVFGEDGTLVTDRLSPTVSLYLGRHLKEPTHQYTPDPLPEDRADLALETLHHLETGQPLHEALDLAVNLDAMAAMDAAFRSAVSGKLEMTGNSCGEVLL